MYGLLGVADGRRARFSSCLWGLVLLVAVLPRAGFADVTRGDTGAFTSTLSITLPGSPEVIYDALTGDISGWWDHTFSDKPARFFIDARPGGGFYEYFDDEGKNGVRHAVVIYAERGKLLRFEGPLGFNGKALLIATEYKLEAEGTGQTRLTVTVNGSGQMETGWPEAIDGVWQHFIGEQFKAYIEAGKHLQ